MTAIPNFWDAGPHDPIPAEATWREFVKVTGGQVVEELVPEPRTFQNADFIFPSSDIVVELKEVSTEFDQSEAFKVGFGSLLKRVIEEDPAWKPSLFGGSGEFPRWFRAEFVRLFRSPISRILKKANRQIRETKAHFKIPKGAGILVMVNDGFTSLEPHFVRSLACSLLVDSYSSIDCFLYVTVNRYIEIEGSDVPRLVWMPSYSDRAPESLVHFVDNLGRDWFKFLETRIGPFTIPHPEVPQNNDSPPMRTRSIVLPGEKR